MADKIVDLVFVCWKLEVGIEEAKTYTNTHEKCVDKLRWFQVCVHVCESDKTAKKRREKKKMIIKK